MQILVSPTPFDFAVSSISMVGSVDFAAEYEVGAYINDGDPLPGMTGTPMFQGGNGILVEGTDYTLTGGTFNLLTPQTSTFIVYISDTMPAPPTTVDLDFLVQSTEFDGDSGNNFPITKTFTMIDSGKLSMFGLPVYYVKDSLSLSDLGVTSLTVPTGGSYFIDQSSISPLGVTSYVIGDPV